MGDISGPEPGTYYVLFALLSPRSPRSIEPKNVRSRAPEPVRHRQLLPLPPPCQDAHFPAPHLGESASVSRTARCVPSTRFPPFRRALTFPERRRTRSAAYPSSRINKPLGLPALPRPYLRDRVSDSRTPRCVGFARFPPFRRALTFPERLRTRSAACPASHMNKPLVAPGFPGPHLRNYATNSLASRCVLFALTTPSRRALTFLEQC